MKYLFHRKPNPLHIAFAALLTGTTDLHNTKLLTAINLFRFHDTRAGLWLVVRMMGGRAV